MTRTIRYSLLTLVVLALAASAALLGGCAQKSAPAPQASAPQAAVAPPTIKLLTPTAGATVPAGDVRMSVQTTGLKFVMPSNTVVAGEGHVHFELDGQPVKMSAEPDYTYPGVTPGVHTLVAELVQNDAKPFSPPVKQEVTFTAK